MYERLRSMDGSDIAVSTSRDHLLINSKFVQTLD